MKSVLISIKPKWCELIVSGKKTVEVRKTKPKLETPFKVYIYCTKQGKQFFHGGIGEKECLFKNPDTEKIKFDYAFELMCCKNEYTKDNFLSGKVIGEFVCNKIEDYSKFEYDYNALLRHIALWAGTKDYFFLDSYLGGEKCCYGWHISNLVIYDKPRELSEFKRDCDGNCQTCKNAVWRTNGWACEPYIVGCLPIKRPPQSWCYVESESQ